MNRRGKNNWFEMKAPQAEKSLTEQLVLSSSLATVSNKDRKPQLQLLAPGTIAYRFTSDENQCHQNVP